MTRRTEKVRSWPSSNDCTASIRPNITTISNAYLYILAQPVPGDRLGRTYAEAIAAAVIRRAMQGDLRAIKEIHKATLDGGDSKQERAVQGMSDAELEAIVNNGASAA